MKWKREAIEIIKIFASGVSCPAWDENTIEQTMFHPCCDDIAEKIGKTEIDEEVVKIYILKEHNSITVKIGRKRNSALDKILNCMVLPKKIDGDWVCVHGNAQVFPITHEEAKSLSKEVEELTRDLR